MAGLDPISANIAAQTSWHALLNVMAGARPGHLFRHIAAIVMAGPARL
jgi:hypothetical protein